MQHLLNPIVVITTISLQMTKIVKFRLRRVFVNRLPFPFLIVFMSLLACNKTPTQPVAQIVVACDPIQWNYRISADSLVPDTSSVFSAYINQLTPIPGYSITDANGLGDWRSLPKSEWYYLKNEFVKSVFDSFTVELSGCANQTQWILFKDDSIVKCLKTDSIAETDSSFTMKWHFTAQKSGKGILQFLVSSYSLKTEGHSEMLIGYSINPKDSMWVSINKIFWIFDTSRGSSVSLALQGETNAFALSLQTFGDGLFNQPFLKIDSLGEFSDTLNIAFSAVGRYIIQASTQLFIYGTVGIPQSILLKNPLDTRQ